MLPFSVVGWNMMSGWDVQSRATPENQWCPHRNANDLNWLYSEHTAMEHYAQPQVRRERKLAFLQGIDADIMALTKVDQDDLAMLKENFHLFTVVASEESYGHLHSDWAQHGYDGKIYHVLLFRTSRFLSHEVLLKSKSYMSWNLAPKASKPMLVPLMDALSLEPLWIVIHQNDPSSKFNNFVGRETIIKLQEKIVECESLHGLLPMLSFCSLAMPPLTGHNTQIHRSHTAAWRLMDAGLLDTWDMSPNLLTYFTEADAGFGFRTEYLFYNSKLSLTCRRDCRIFLPKQLQHREKARAMEGKRALMEVFGSDHLPMVAEFLLLPTNICNVMIDTLSPIASLTHSRMWRERTCLMEQECRHHRPVCKQLYWEGSCSNRKTCKYDHFITQHLPTEKRLANKNSHKEESLHLTPSPHSTLMGDDARKRRIIASK
jgi:hypothetical protein